MEKNSPSVCGVCGLVKDPDDIVPGGAVRPALAALILKDHPDWTPERTICRDDLNRYRAQYVQAALEAEKGDLSAIESEVIRSLREGEVLARNVNMEFEERRTLGQRLADRLAAFGGSWKFILIFMGVLLSWIVLNSIILASRRFDPFPFILLNLFLSCLAALQAPIIMMSQNRQEAKDRLRAQHDYQINLKAEIEIRGLHEKIDHLIFKQWQRLLEIQEIQTELMGELSEKIQNRL
ncbi:MAG: DUF1003 domain-containing protein [Candidatus Aminicenantes bacterium]|nr:DUF1003 domain-containing protein [Candidatus Aminicenantes bacterium]NLH76296.1 DUF1003 domain-containing protein [Acidobacteriota bacterium]